MLMEIKFKDYIEILSVTKILRALISLTSLPAKLLEGLEEMSEVTT